MDHASWITRATFSEIAVNRERGYHHHAEKMAMDRDVIDREGDCF